nr:hypothetical protein [Tanacetum cinerariifolium]
MYHKKNVDFAYLLWEDFVYQVEHKDAKKSNEMYYPRFTKVIINFFMNKVLSIPRRNKVNWHYVRDDQMFTTIMLVSRYQNTQQFSAMLHVELTNEDIRNSTADKEYYAIASGAAPPKTKASIRKTHSSSNTTMPPSTAAGTRLSNSAKRKQLAKSTKAKGLSVLSEVALTEAEQIKLATKRSLKQTHISQASRSGIDEGTGSILGVPDVPTNKSDDEISWKSSDEDNDDDDQEDEDEQDDDDQDDKYDDQDSDNDGDDFVHPKLSTHDEEAKDEESFDPIVQTPSQVENSNDESNDDASHGMNVGGEEGPNAEDDDEELYRDVNINLECRDVQMTDVHTTQVLEDTHVTLTPVNPDGQQQSSYVPSQFVTSMLNPNPVIGIDYIFESTHRVDAPVSTTVVPLLVTAPTLPSLSIPIMSQVQQAPTPTLKTAPSSFLQDLLNFGSLFGLDHRIKTLEANFSKFMQTNQFSKDVSSIPGIVDRYIDHQMNEAIKEAVQLQSDRLRDEAQAENEDFINKLDENIQKIIKEQVKDQVKVQVSKILPKIEKTVNEQLEAEVLTRSSNSSKTSYAVVADLSELEQKKILIKKMESNKSDRGSKRRREGKDPESTSAQKEKASKTTGKSTEGSKFHQKTADTLSPELLAGLRYELMKGSCKSLVELEFFLEEVYKVTTDQLDWNNPEGQQYSYNLLKPLPLIPNSRGCHVIPFDHFINNDLEYLRGGASSRKYTTSFTKTKAADYGHIKDDDKLYKFKEGDFKRLRIQDIEDLLLLLVQGKLTNLTAKERFAFNPDTYKTDLKRKEAYTAYSNPRGFIYQNKDKQNKLMQIDKLYKFSDDTLNDVRTALDYRLKGIRMKYLPQTIWRRNNKERAATMIQAIDKQLKTRRVMQSLEKFVGGRLYEGDFRMLQQVI